MTATSDDVQIDNPQGKVTQWVVLENVSWQTYKLLLTDIGDHRASRLTYDRGTLESGRAGALLPPSPLRTVLASFPAHGSSESLSLLVMDLLVTNQVDKLIVGVCIFPSVAFGNHVMLVNILAVE